MPAGRPRGDPRARRGVGGRDRPTRRRGRARRRGGVQRRAVVAASRAATRCWRARSRPRSATAMHLSSPVTSITWRRRRRLVRTAAVRDRRRRGRRRRARAADRRDRVRPGAARAAPRRGRERPLRARREAVRAAARAPRDERRPLRPGALLDVDGARRRRGPAASSTRSRARSRRSSGWTVADGPERWLASVARLRPDLALEPDGAVLSTWANDPWARGAYSAHTPGGNDPALAALVWPAGARGRVHRRESGRADGGRARSGIRAAGQLTGR